MTDAAHDPKEWSYNNGKVEVLTYAYTTTITGEEILGRVCSKSATKTAKLFVTLTQPYGIFVENPYKPPIDSEATPLSTYGLDGKSVGVMPFVGGQIFKLILDDGQTIKAGQLVQAEATTGKIQAYDGKQAPIGYAWVGASASGADGEIFVVATPNEQPVLIAQEAVTISSDYGYLANTPAFEIVELEATTGTYTGPLQWMRTGTPNNNGHVKINMTTGQIDTYNAAAITAIKAEYKILPKTY